MKRLLIVLMFCMSSNVFSQDNLQYLDIRGLTYKFPTKPLKHKYSLKEVDAEMDLWVEAIEFAINSIDPAFFQDYGPEKKIRVIFFVDDNVKIKAFYIPSGRENSFVEHEGIYINLFRDVKAVKKKVKSYEILEGDGDIDKTERITLFMHELGHKVNSESSDITVAWFQFTQDDAVLIATEDRREDMANSFFMYALWPEHLEKNHQDQFDAIDENVGDLFNFDLEMPCSIRSMLTAEYELKEGEKVCLKKEGKVKNILRSILFFTSLSFL